MIIFTGLDKYEGEPNAVVVGLAPEHFNYDELNKAFRYFVFKLLESLFTNK